MYLIIIWYFIFFLIFINVVKRETNLINIFLGTLTKHINTIERVGLVESKVELFVIMTKVACIWINCPHFQNYDYIIVLIKVICNMIVSEVSKKMYICGLFMIGTIKHLGKCILTYVIHRVYMTIDYKYKYL